MRATPSPTLLLSALILSLSAAPAAAEDRPEPSRVRAQAAAEDAPRRVSLGVRIGGYGFRHLNEQEALAWDNCRMDGIGLTGAYDWTPHLYTEAGVDAYFAVAETMRQGLDRLSLHVSALAGYRFAPNFLISPNIHIGLGAEWTRVEVYGNRDSGLFPVGFLGVGGELNIKDLRFGMSIRANAMQLPQYDWQSDAPDQTVRYETELAGQALFSFRYVI